MVWNVSLKSTGLGVRRNISIQGGIIMYIDIDIDDLIVELKKNYDVENIFTDGDILYYVTHNFDPDQVFPINELIQWALDNGFTREE